MKPVIALVGLPNVGKSTLFNCLTRSRDALVANYPGLTRDRKYGTGKLGDYAYIVVDTGGVSTDASDINDLMVSQVQQAVDEADLVLFLIDARAGITAADEALAASLRKRGKPIFLVANKIDGIDIDDIVDDSYRLGLGQLYPIAAVHGRGVLQLLDAIYLRHPGTLAAPDVSEDRDDRTCVAVIGRPNVGKSTLINRILGEQRVIAFDQPGTTRDSIYIPFSHPHGEYMLIDTAGVRKRAKVKQTVEKFSVIKALQAIAEAHVVIQVIDAVEGVTEQDLTLSRHVLVQGRALVLVTNKWDQLDAAARKAFKDELSLRAQFIDFAEFHFISALHGQGVGRLLAAVKRAYASAMLDVPTAKLTELLHEATTLHQPPLQGRHRAKLRYAHQGGKNPLIIVIHGNKLDQLPQSYQRYLVNYFHKRLKLTGTPLHLRYKTSENPFASRKKPRAK